MFTRIAGRTRWQGPGLAALLIAVAAGTPAASAGGNMPERCEKEIVELHEFFESWFNGELPRDDASFARFEAVLSQDFELVGPGGSLFDRAGILDGVRDGHARSGEEPMRIWIRNVRVRPVHDSGWMATYEEWQQTGNDRRGRLSSVLFVEDASAPNGVVWKHVHETWLSVDED